MRLMAPHSLRLSGSHPKPLNRARSPVHCTVTVTVLTADCEYPGATAMNLSTALVVKEIGPMYLVDEVVGVVPLVV